MAVSIALDAMGGDNAPHQVVRGAVLAAQASPQLRIFLVGKPDSIEAELERLEADRSRIEIVPADAVIGMGDSPVEALREKRGSSIEVALRLVREGRASAFLSAGNTGACVAASSMFLGRLKLVKRPGIAVVFETTNEPVVVIDVGANVACKPDHLVQYAIMASLYAREILGVAEPRVGLLNIGEEDEKGHALAKETYGRVQKAPVNFIGNVEGADIFKGNVNVVVCDGFVGNIVLKVSEGLAEHLLKMFIGAFQGVVGSMPQAQNLAPVVDEASAQLLARIDYSEYGGAPLLGVDGTAIIAHGRSDFKAISNAIKVAERMAALDLNSRITAELGALSPS